MVLNNKMRIAIVLVVIAAIGAFYLATIRDGQGWSGDYALYILHAKNIIEGVDYGDTPHIYNPNRPNFSPGTYPPAYPLLLAPLYRFFGLDFAAMKIEIIVLFLLSLLLIYFIFKSELPFGYVVLMIALIGLNPWLWNFKNEVRADVPFLFFVCVCFLLIRRAYGSDRSRTSPLLYGIPVGLVIYLSYATRSIGAVLVACLFVYEIIRFKRLTRFFAFAAGTFLLLAVLQNIFVHNEAGYLAQCKIRAKVVSVNVGVYAKGLYYMWGQGRDRVFHGVLFIILNGLAVIGFLARIRKKITFFEIFALLYMGVLFVWPVVATRFLIPVMPLYVYYVFSGVSAINVFERKAIETSAFILLIAAVFYSYGIRYEGMDFGPILNGVTKEESVQLFDYVKKEPDEGRVYIFRKPRVLALYTGRRASICHQSEDDRVLWYYFRKIGATHIIVGPPSLKENKFIASFAERNWKRLQKVFSNADFTVYAIIK